MIDVEDIKNLNSKAIKEKSQIATLASKIVDKINFSKKNIVKVITEKKLSNLVIWITVAAGL